MGPRLGRAAIAKGSQDACGTYGYCTARSLNAEELLRQAEDRIELASRHREGPDYSNAYLEATRSLRPLRILMRAHWDQATKTLDIPTASPYAVSFFTLPKHWELHRELHGTTAGPNALRDGDFEAVASNPNFIQAIQFVEDNLPLAPEAKTVADPKNPKIDKPAKDFKNVGLPVTDLPGWTVQQQTIDAVSYKPDWCERGGQRWRRKRSRKGKKALDPSTGFVDSPSFRSRSWATACCNCNPAEGRADPKRRQAPAVPARWSERTWP